MRVRRPTIAGLLGLLCCFLSGCAANSDLYVDESRASVSVVRGYIESGKIHRWPDCGYWPEMEGAISCSPGLRSVATFVVEQVIVGAPARKRLRVHFSYAQYWPEVALGRRYQYLAAILSDGGLHELEGVAPVALTTEGQWALPIMKPLGSPFPCSSYDLEWEPLRFPKESLEGLGFDEEDDEGPASDDSYTVDAVSLEHVPAAYAGKRAARVAGECH